MIKFGLLRRSNATPRNDISSPKTASSSNFQQLWRKTTKQSIFGNFLDCFVAAKAASRNDVGCFSTTFKLPYYLCIPLVVEYSKCKALPSNTLL
ncbi:hypothetical protein [Candidatus Tisiphia endosymbiont of Oplodontha viridula]|uniref:hypothetical protein n=1 Tax=Candidatus Tisiphia endosymbiont of Oplodontha viridula TaxID=3077925 RepID=UPI0035C8D5B8